MGNLFHDLLREFGDAMFAAGECAAHLKLHMERHGGEPEPMKPPVFTNASDNLKLIALMAEQADAQVWLERVADTKEDVGILIEDGHLAQVESRKGRES
jgi:hypothetical protein